MINILSNNKENLSLFNDNNHILSKMIKRPTEKIIVNNYIIKELKTHIIKHRNKNNLKQYFCNKIIYNNNLSNKSNKSNKIINERLFNDKMEKK